MRARLTRGGVLLMTAATLTGAAGRADASLLLGTQVTGVMNIAGAPANFFDPANGYVPSGYLNKTDGTTVTIADPAVEFGFQDGNNLDTADFTDTTLTLTDVSKSSSVSNTYQFTNAAFAGLTLLKTSDTFTGGVTANLDGTTLTIVAPEFGLPGTYAATFSFRSATVPEPSTITLAATAGLMGLGGSWRRRKAKSAV